MGGVDLPRPAAQAVAPLLPHEMEHIRKVYDDDLAGKKHASIITPREDAQMFRTPDKHGVPCECIIELYELLWRWGHRNPKGRGFAENFGFSIPDTMVIVKGRPYAWYFISKKDGSLLRKSEGHISLSALEKKIAKEPAEGSKETAKNTCCAVWMPMASQFPEARCHTPYADFLSVQGFQKFVMQLRDTHSGILQAFVDPHSVSNFLVRTVEFRRQTSLCLRTNRSLLASGKGSLFDRCATFEGWEGLSSSSSRYRNHRHPHMEDLILAASETLNRRAEQERVRQMLFLGPHQHVALHFKVTSDHQLFFIFASIVSEKDVILQIRPQLLMGDPCMTEELPGAALLPGGTNRKAAPFEAPACYTAARGPSPEEEEEAKKASSQREGSLPPIERSGRLGSGKTPRQRPLSDRRPMADDGAILPRMGYAKPVIPDVPYTVLDPPRTVEDYAYHAVETNSLDMGLKRPLIAPTSARAAEMET
mmetsp:Transcript_58356/g.103737  ORF Transcript_58356/g.103737 Transcript_58356/m.103737 type:complete len:478 (-) Transcript_58356:87-1520(-)